MIDARVHDLTVVITMYTCLIDLISIIAYQSQLYNSNSFEVLNVVVVQQKPLSIIGEEIYLPRA